MTPNDAIDTMQEHEEISALMPWYVNGTVSDVERQRIDSHLLVCATCREDLVQERRVFQRVATEASVEYMPAASLKRLQAQLDALDANASRSVPAELDAKVGMEASARRNALPTQRSWRRSIPQRELMAASIAVVGLVIGLFAANRWTEIHARESQPNYYTVTTSATHPAGEVIRAVFVPTITLIELQSILEESQLRIVSGPTEAGVYSLAATSPRSVNSSLALLRHHSTVRFAESTQPLADIGASR